jgi:hypothetical protein
LDNKVIRNWSRSCHGFATKWETKAAILRMHSDEISTRLAAKKLHLECYVYREVVKFKEEEERHRRELAGVKIPAYVMDVNSCI